MDERDRYRLIEVLDPELTHFEFFLSRPPLEKTDWSDQETLLAAIPERHPCIEGWPSRSFFNYEYQVVAITEAEFAFMEKCNPQQGKSVADILAEIAVGDRSRRIGERAIAAKPKADYASAAEKIKRRHPLKLSVISIIAMI